MSVGLLSLNLKKENPLEPFRFKLFLIYQERRLEIPQNSIYLQFQKDKYLE